jgi:hypothetical protein
VSVARRRGQTGWGWALLALVLAATALPPLRGEDPVAAAAIWATAGEIGGGELTRRVYTDAARVNARVAPWQAAFPEARRRLRAIADGRRAALPHDRGGRRRNPPPHPDDPPLFTTPPMR